MLYLPHELRPSFKLAAMSGKVFNQDQVYQAHERGVLYLCKPVFEEVATI